MTRILIVGGAGFIGSHTCLTLLNSDHELIILDNFSNSSPIALKRVSKIANNSKLKIKKIISANEMFEAVKKCLPVDIAICAAAVADFKPVVKKNKKITRSI